MENEQRDTRRAGMADRQWAIDALCEAYATDQIEMPELERRLDLANRATTAAELAELVHGFSVSKPRPGIPAAAPATAPQRPGQDVAAKPAPRPVANIARVPDRQIEFAFWSGRVRKGSWTPARRITAIACMGGVELDFREARFGTETVEILAIAVMGGVDIVVPPGVHVDTTGFAILGGFEDVAPAPETPEGAPVLKISGFAVMGGVDVSVRMPGESVRDAKRRLRDERRKRIEARKRDR